MLTGAPTRCDQVRILGADPYKGRPRECGLEDTSRLAVRWRGHPKVFSNTWSARYSSYQMHSGVQHQSGMRGSRAPLTPNGWLTRASHRPRKRVLSTLSLVQLFRASDALGGVHTESPWFNSRPSHLWGGSSTVERLSWPQGLLSSSFADAHHRCLPGRMPDGCTSGSVSPTPRRRPPSATHVHPRLRQVSRSLHHRSPWLNPTTRSTQ